MAELGYIRVSTFEQDPSLQRSALIEEGVEEQNIWFDVMGGAVKAGGRPEWTKLSAYARAGDTVTVWRIDRLGRSLVDILTTVADLQARDIGVRSLSDGIDPSTASGRLLLGLFGTLAEYERELIRERVVAGIAAAKANGVLFGRPAPDPDTVAAKLAVARHAMLSGKSAGQAAQMVGWSRSTFYRHGGPLRELVADDPHGG